MSRVKGTKSPGSGRRTIRQPTPTPDDDGKFPTLPPLLPTWRGLNAFRAAVSSLLARGIIDPRIAAEQGKLAEGVAKDLRHKDQIAATKAKMRRDDRELEELRAMVAEGRERERRAVAAANGVATGAAERTQPAPA